MVLSSNRKLSYRMQMTSFFQMGCSLSISKRHKVHLCESKECEEVRKMLAGRPCLPVRGTMKLHGAFASKDVLWTRATSCYCEECFTGCELQPSCDGWSSDKVNKSTTSTSSKGKKTKKLQGDMGKPSENSSPKEKIS